MYPNFCNYLFIVPYDLFKCNTRLSELNKYNLQSKENYCTENT